MPLRALLRHRRGRFARDRLSDQRSGDQLGRSTGRPREVRVLARLAPPTPSAATAAVAALFDSSHQLGTETGYLRLVVRLLGIRQQPFKSVDALLKVDSLFEVHGYFTLRPSL